MTSYAGVVNGFTLDVAMFLFILSHPNIKVKNRAGIYSVNEANWKKWDTQTKKYVDDFKNTSCSLRYIGSMVSDVHRTLLYGGIFMYPHDSSVILIIRIESKGEAKTLIRMHPNGYDVQKCRWKSYQWTRKYS